MMMSGGLGVVWLGKVGMWQADMLEQDDAHGSVEYWNILCPND